MKYHGRISFLEMLLYILTALGLFYLFGIPAILGFNPAQKHRWGPPDESAAILRERLDEINHVGRVIINTGDGEVEIETRDGEITRTIITGNPGEEAVADAARIARGEFPYART